MKNLSIRTQLLLLTTTIVAVVLVLGTYQFLSGRSITRARVESNVLQVAQVAAANVEQLLEDAQTSVERVGADHSSRTGETRSECHDRLQRSGAIMPQFDALFEVGRDGDVLCSSLGLGDQRFSVADTSWFRRLREGARTVVDRPRVGPVSGRWVAVVVGAVQDEDGRFLGATGVSVHIGRFQQMLSNVTLPSGMVITMVDQEAFVVARSVDPEQWVGQQLDLATLIPGRDPYAGPGTAGVESMDGVERVWGWATVRGSSWIVFAGLPTSWVDVPVRDAVLTGGAVAVGLLVLAGLLALTLYRQIAGALDALVDQVRAAVHGRRGTIEPGGPSELREVAAGLNQILHERRELESEIRHRQKMEALGRFAGGIAHDFNNVLTVIQGTASMVAAELDEDDPVSGPIDQIRMATERAAGLTRQLLTFSRKEEAEVEPVRVNELVGEMEQMLRRIIGGDVVFRTDLASDLPETIADPGQLEQVLMNLVVNARDAMPRGGELTICTGRVPPGDVLPTPEAADGGAGDPGERDWIRIVVSDTGHGIAPEVRERIFEPFFTTKARDRGTGLGLATVYAIVHRFGGRVDFRSRAGEGTEFHIHLPTVGKSGTAG